MDSPPPCVATEPSPDLDLADDRRLTGSPHATDTNAALRALARAARSFLIYDHHNQAIRQFLAEYQRAMTVALSHGPMALEVRPFELVLTSDLATEVVYLQRERDRSLAFRLYRDGVRRVIIDTGVEWPELLRLLEILSIRYTGVRQHEDDLVTLLWKAGFQHIETISVEGFMLTGDEDEDDEEEPVSAGSAHSARKHGPAFEVPADWDRPMPSLPQGNVDDLAHHPVPAAVCTEFHHEVSSLAVGTLAVGLCADMLALVRDPVDPTTLTEVSNLLDEVRDLLLADGQLARLLALARAIAELNDHTNDTDLPQDAVSAALQRFTDCRALGRILQSAARTEGALPTELTELLDLVPGDHLEALVQAMEGARASGSRALAGRLVEREVERRPDSVARLVPFVTPELGGDLLRALAHVDPARAVVAVEGIVERDAPELQGEIKRLVREAPDSVLDPDRLVGWLASPVEPTRLAVLERIGRTGSSAHYTPLRRHLERLSGSAYEEAIAVGVAMARVAPQRSLEDFGDIVRPRSLFGRMRGTAVTGIGVWSAVSALGSLPGDYCETAIRWRMERAGEDLYRHCRKTLHLRRVSGTGSGSNTVATGDAFYVRGPFRHPGKLMLTDQMFCFAPTRSRDRWLGASDLDLPIRSIDLVDVDDGGPTLLVHMGDTCLRFEGGDVTRVGTALLGRIGNAWTTGDVAC